MTISILEKVHKWNMKKNGWEQTICVNQECVTSFWSKEEMTVTIRIGVSQTRQPIVTFTYWDYMKRENVHKVSTSYWRNIYKKTLKYLERFEPQLRN